MKCLFFSEFYHTEFNNKKEASHLPLIIFPFLYWKFYEGEDRHLLSLARSGTRILIWNTQWDQTPDNSKGLQVEYANSFSVASALYI